MGRTWTSRGVGHPRAFQAEGTGLARAQRWERRMWCVQECVLGSEEAAA